MTRITKHSLGRTRRHYKGKRDQREEERKVLLPMYHLEYFLEHGHPPPEHAPSTHVTASTQPPKSDSAIERLVEREYFTPFTQQTLEDLTPAQQEQIDQHNQTLPSSMPPTEGYQDVADLIKAVQAKQLANNKDFGLTAPDDDFILGF